MLHSLKEFFGGLREAWRTELDSRWRAAIVIGVLVGVIFGTATVAAHFAEKGCSIQGFGSLVLNGFMGLFMTAIGMVCVAAVMAGIFHLPDGMRRLATAVRDELDYRRSLREQGVRIERDWARVRWHVCFWPLLIAAVTGVSLTLGYVAWMLVC